jgi:hypothetical protein
MEELVFYLAMDHHPHYHTTIKPQSIALQGLIIALLQHALLFSMITTSLLNLSAVGYVFSEVQTVLQVPISLEQNPLVTADCSNMIVGKAYCVEALDKQVLRRPIQVRFRVRQSSPLLHPNQWSIQHLHLPPQCLQPLHQPLQGITSPPQWPVNQVWSTIAINSTGSPRTSSVAKSSATTKYPLQTSSNGTQSLKMTALACGPKSTSALA